MPSAPPRTAHEYRYEKKSLIEGCSLAQIMHFIKMHPAMFRELYPPRYVNNIYLDTPLLSDYFSNLNGYTSRGKVRVRWYHQLFHHVDDGILEFKIKEGEVGRKEQFPFPPFTLDSNLTEGRFKAAVRGSDLPDHVKYKLRDLEFALLNRYTRWYFATPGERYRLTIDAELTSWRLTKFVNSFNQKREEHDKHIIELKYQTADDPGVQRILSGLPFRVTRSSKYIAGVDSVYL